MLLTNDQRFAQGPAMTYLLASTRTEEKVLVARLAQFPNPDSDAGSRWNTSRILGYEGDIGAR